MIAAPMLFVAPAADKSRLSVNSSAYYLVDGNLSSLIINTR
jgi:hypothetical protein